MEDSRKFVRIEMIQVLPTPTPCNPLSTSLSLIIPLFEMGEATFNVISSNFIFLLWPCLCPFPFPFPLFPSVAFSLSCSSFWSFPVSTDSFRSRPARLFGPQFSSIQIIVMIIKIIERKSISRYLDVYKIFKEGPE